MKLNRISAVIPAYKAERTIARAIDSILRQEGVEASVVVVVDGDLDGTARIVQGYTDPRVRLVVNPANRGVQYSRNRGLSLVEDEFVMFLDSDDFVEGPLLEGLSANMISAGADLGLGPMQTLFERSGGRGATTLLDTRQPRELFTGWLAENKFVSPCSVLWRTSFVREIGGWDPQLNRQEDGELVMRAILAGAKVAGSDRGRGVYVIHDSHDRLTRRSDNLGSLLAVPDKLLRMSSTVVEPALIEQACSQSYYNAAYACFLKGNDGIGREALRRARQLGFKGHRGSRGQKLVSRLLGLRYRSKIERLVRMVARRPA
jgi:glycosyltransferase involved in cell wall biosynthesis